MVLAEISCIAVMTEDLSGDKPDALEMIQVRSARRLLDEARSGIYRVIDDAISD